MNIRQALNEKVHPLVLDGGFGTMVQRYGLKEEDFRGYRYRDIPGMMLGNNEMLCMTRPDVVSDIYRAYVEAGADILTANTFSANSISQADYNCQHLVGDMNREAVRLARRAFAESGRQGFVIATVGPTNKSLSISPDINDPACRAITFDQLAEAYMEQIDVLAQEGVDAILLETIFDTLNAKAGIYAMQEVMHRTGKDIPLMLSVTVNDSAGRLLSGQTLEAFLISVAHAPILSIGLNCSFGADQMLPVLRNLHRMLTERAGENGKRIFISCHPNAGLPNSMGQYDVNPEQFAQTVRPMIEEGLADIIGGCCGTTPEHIKALVDICI
jgi:5-methyltetrahydrofolate--homocysteine methyltransferase